MYEITPSTQAILLLTSSFSDKKSEDVTPLNSLEWGRFALWLHEHTLKPENLLQNNFEELLAQWEDSEITITRLKKLLNRGAALALAMEKWQRVGIWVITRASSDYPKQLKKKLEHRSPPVLFGIGNPKLLNNPSLAVVGARKAPKDALEFADKLAKKIANNGYTLVSGGAKGIDETAMMGALRSGGTVIGILPDNLLKMSLLGQYRNALMNNDLVLISTNYPESPFSAFNALKNNKYIYTQSLAAVVVHSETKGGTWSGATEALKESYTSLWVKEPSTDLTCGNQELVSLGANLLSSDIFENSLDTLWNDTIRTKTPDKPTSLFDTLDTEEISSNETESKEKFKESDKMESISFFDFFMSKLFEEYTVNDIFKPKELEEKFDLKQSQVTEWIIEAEEKNLVQRLDGRVKKYQLI